MNSIYTTELMDLPLEVKVYIKNLENIIEAQNNWINTLDNKIDKAKEYIEERFDGEVFTHTFDKCNMNELLEILGDKENE